MIGNKERQRDISALFALAAFMEAVVTSIELSCVSAAEINRMYIYLFIFTIKRATNGIRMGLKCC